MKLLQVVPTLNPASGGIVPALSSLNGALMRSGHETRTVCLDAPEAAWLAHHEGAVTALGPGRGSYQYHPGLRFVLLEQCAAADACLVHGLWQYPGLASRSAARRSGRPYFVFPHGMLDPWFKRTYPLKHLKKWLYWPWGEYRVLRDAAAVLFTCEEEKRLARESFPRLYRAREEVVGLGLRDEQRDHAALKNRFLLSHPELAGKRVLLFLGRLHPKKGLELLLQAFGQISANDRDLRLVIAGAVSGTGVGPGYLAALRQLADRSCPARAVIFCGLLEGGDKWGALSAADAFVLPSHQENFGMAVVEALSCSTPVLISDKVNIWREIEKDDAGLVETDTLEGTRRLLERWISLPEAERLPMRQRARSCFGNRFEAGQVAEALIRILAGAPERKPLPPCA
jgi:glycosyltransferase involved in cell wall biosynthesis